MDLRRLLATSIVVLAVAAASRNAVAQTLPAVETPSPSAAVTASPLDAATLLAKHRAYVGWDASDGSVRSWIAAAARGRNLVSRTYRRGTAYRTENEPTPKGYGTSDGFTGTRFWTANENRNAVDLNDADARAQRSINLVWSEAAALVTDATLRGSFVVEGVPTRVVRLAPPDADAMFVFVDADGAFRRVFIELDPLTHRGMEMLIDRYVAIAPGKRAIGSYRRSPHDAPLVITYSAVNAPIADRQIAVPQPLSSWTFDPAHAALPIAVERGAAEGARGRVVVIASLDGRTGRYLLDSGEKNIIYFQNLVNGPLMGRTGRGAYLSRAGGYVMTESHHVARLVVGKNVLRNVNVLRSIGTSTAGLDGILGFDFFAQIVADANLSRKTLRILPPAARKPERAPNATTLAVDLSSFRPVIAATVTGDAPLETMMRLDTGSPFSVLLDDYRKPRGARTNGPVLGGFDGTALVPTKCFALGELTIGAIAIPSAQACAAPAAPSEGGIGFGILGGYDWLIDFPARTFTLTPTRK